MHARFGSPTGWRRRYVLGFVVGLFATLQAAIPVRAQTPAVLIVAPHHATSDAVRFASKLADGGILALIYRFDTYATQRYNTWQVHLALDSLRRRHDVLPGKVGILAIGTRATGIQWLADFVGDSLLAFAVATHTSPTKSDLALYQAARVGTLVLRPFTPALDTLHVIRAASAVIPNPADPHSQRIVSLVQTVGTHVTIWPVSAAALARLDTPFDPTVDRVVKWVQDRVGATLRRPESQELPEVRIVVRE